MTQYSYSRVSLFQQCPLKFKFHYIDKVEVEEEEAVAEEVLEAEVPLLIHFRKLRKVELLFNLLKVKLLKLIQIQTMNKRLLVK